MLTQQKSEQQKCFAWFPAELNRNISEFWGMYCRNIFVIHVQVNNQSPLDWTLMVSNGLPSSDSRWSVLTSTRILDILDSPL